jgi:outer membrane protein OmpA-like peptidoglycan-associated protein
MVGAAALAAAPVAFSADPVRDLNAILRALAPIDGPLEADTPPPSIDLAVAFALNSASLEPSAIRQLDELGGALRSPALAGFRFEIGGHTDATGGAARNRALSLARAAAVKDYLVGRHGIDPARLDVAGWGAERPSDPVNPAAAINRRVEIVTLGPTAVPSRPVPVRW